jgi:hypothetical protein
MPLIDLADMKPFFGNRPIPCRHVGTAAFGGADGADVPIRRHDSGAPGWGEARRPLQATNLWVESESASGYILDVWRKDWFRLPL